MVGAPSSPSGAAATETQAASRPASAGRVPSIGSTTSTHSAGAAGLDEAAVLGVEGHARGARGDELLEQRLRVGVDGERDVAPGAVGALVRASGVGAELGRHPLAQRARQLEDEVLH